MIGVDFDFAQYVAQRRGQMEKRARDGAAYAFAGEFKARRMLATARPVSMAIEATGRRWRSSAKDKLLGDATLVTDQSYPALRAAGARAAERLNIKCPPLFVAPESTGIEAQALGTDADPILVVSSAFAEGLDETELTALIGHLLGHVQNNHVMLATALFYLRHDALFFVRWIVQPAIMALQAWSRRADISCDRAALIATGVIEPTLSFVVKTGTSRLDADVPSVLADIDESGGGRSFVSMFKSHPNVPKRVAALRLFADSTLFRRVTGSDEDGRPTEDIDNDVGNLLSLF